MTILYYFFSNSFDGVTYFPRKLTLPNRKSFFLYGARGVGKSYLIFNYLKESNKNYLYIDCQDPAFILEDLDINELEDFIKDEEISILVLDHYFKDFLKNFPKVEQLIVVGRDLIDINLPRYRLYPLDFEEFLNFNRSYKIENAFNKFTKKGSLPLIAKENTLHFRELFFEKFDTQEGRVLLILAIFNTKIVTTHQIFLKSKEYFRVSKDWIYKTIKALEAEGVIYYIDTIQKSMGKKLIIYDFALSRYLNKEQSFLRTLDSIVALSLIKENRDILASITPLGYLIKELFIQISPFDNEDVVWRKVQDNFGFYSKNGVKRVILITVSSSFNFKIKDVSFIATPFYEWIVGR